MVSDPACLRIGTQNQPKSAEFFHAPFHDTQLFAGVSQSVLGRVLKTRLYSARARFPPPSGVLPPFEPRDHSEGKDEGGIGRCHP